MYILFIFISFREKVKDNCWTVSLHLYDDINTLARIVLYVTLYFFEIKLFLCSCTYIFLFAYGQPIYDLIVSSL